MGCTPSVLLSVVVADDSAEIVAGTTSLCVQGACEIVSWTPAGGDSAAYLSSAGTSSASLRQLQSGYALLGAGFTLPGGWSPETDFRVVVNDALSQATADYTRRVNTGYRDCAGCGHGEVSIEPGAQPNASCKSAPCTAGVVLDQVFEVPLAVMSGATLELCYNDLCASGSVGTWSDKAPMGGGSNPLAGDTWGDVEVYLTDGRFDLSARLPLAGIAFQQSDVGRVTITAADGSIVAAGERTGFDQTFPNGEACSGPIGCRRISLEAR